MIKQDTEVLIVENNYVTLSNTPTKIIRVSDYWYPDILIEGWQLFDDDIYIECLSDNTKIMVVYEYRIDLKPITQVCSVLNSKIELSYFPVNINSIYRLDDSAFEYAPCNDNINYEINGKTISLWYDDFSELTDNDKVFIGYEFDYNLVQPEIYEPKYNTLDIIDIDRLVNIDSNQTKELEKTIKSDRWYDGAIYLRGFMDIIRSINFEYGKTPIIYISPYFAEEYIFTDDNVQKIFDRIEHLGIDILLANIEAWHIALFKVDDEFVGIFRVY